MNNWENFSDSVEGLLHSKCTLIGEPVKQKHGTLCKVQPEPILGPAVSSSPYKISRNEDWVLHLLQRLQRSREDLRYCTGNFQWELQGTFEENCLPNAFGE